MLNIRHLIILVAIMFTTGQVSAATIIQCDSGRWEGSRVGFDYDGVPAPGKNGISLDEYRFYIPNEVSVGTEILVSYGTDVEFTARVLSLNTFIEVRSGSEHITYHINLKTGGVILIKVNVIFGFWIDSYQKPCAIL